MVYCVSREVYIHEVYQGIIIFYEHDIENIKKFMSSIEYISQQDAFENYGVCSIAIKEKITDLKYGNMFTIKEVELSDIYKLLKGS